MIKNNFKAKSLARAGIIASIYIVLTLIFYPISFGGMQVRVSEGLTLLPLIFPEAVFGLTIGCLIANLFGNGVLDIVFGTLATFVSAVLTMCVGKRIKNTALKIFVSGLFPVIINAIVIPFTFLVAIENVGVYIISAVQIFVGQAISVYLFGSPIYLFLKNKKRS